MRRINMAFLLNAATVHGGPIADIVLAAKVQDTIDAEKLLAGLKAAKFNVEIESGERRHIVRVLSGESGILSPADTKDKNPVTKDRLVAFANSDSVEEAILHSVLGYFRERQHFAPAAPKS